MSKQKLIGMVPEVCSEYVSWPPMVQYHECEVCKWYGTEQEHFTVETSAYICDACVEVAQNGVGVLG